MTAIETVTTSIIRSVMTTATMPGEMATGATIAKTGIETGTTAIIMIGTVITTTEMIVDEIADKQRRMEMVGLARRRARLLCYAPAVAARADLVSALHSR